MSNQVTYRVMAEQFSSQLDDLFNMDSGLDTLVQDVESK